MNERKWRNTRAPRITAEEVKIDLLRVTELLGHAPSYEEMRRYGNVSPTTCQRRFGNWEAVKRQVGWIPTWESFKPKEIEPTDGQWLAGLIDGEGCFTMRRPVVGHSAWDPVFTISIRDDDSFMIDELVRILGIENTHLHTDNRKACIAKGIKANPAIKLTIYDIHTLHYQLIPALDIYPLRSKKKNEIKIFELAVATLIQKKEDGRYNLRYNDDEKAFLAKCYHALKALKQYKADYKTILQSFDL